MCEKFSFFAGPDFIFDLFSSGNPQTDNDSAKEKDSRIHSNDILGVGIETGFEYTFKNPSGFRIGFSASGDFIKFTQLTDSYKMKRICYYNKLYRNNFFKKCHLIYTNIPCVKENYTY